MISDDAVKLLIALLIGGAIGIEREYRDKSAGFRTLIFICVGSTLFTIFSLKLGEVNNQARIAAQIVSGVGFLGAGAILRDTGGRVMGLTTAATIWLVAALGMGVGGGYYALCLEATVVILMVLWLFPKVEAWIDNMREGRMYEIVSGLDPALYDEFELLFQNCGIRVQSRRRFKAGETMVSRWYVHGSPDKHHLLAEKLFVHPHVIEFRN